MKVLDTTPITNSAQFPIKKGTLKFLQDSSKETASAIMHGIIGDTYSTSAIYVMHGIINSGAGSVYIISDGFIFYNGEIYDVDAASFTAGVGQTAIATIVTTQYTTDADPVTFTDGTIKNVHNIRKIVFSAGVSGSGIVDFAGLNRVVLAVPPALNLMGAGSSTVTGVYPDLTVFTPAISLHPCLYAGSFNVGDVGGGTGTTYAITFPSIGTANYYIVGTMISDGTPSQDCNIVWVVWARTSTSFNLRVAETSVSTQNLAFEYMLFEKL